MDTLAKAVDVVLDKLTGYVLKSGCCDSVKVFTLEDPKGVSLYTTHIISYSDNIVIIGPHSKFIFAGDGDLDWFSNEVKIEDLCGRFLTKAWMPERALEAAESYARITSNAVFEELASMIKEYVEHKRGPLTSHEGVHRLFLNNWIPGVCAHDISEAGLSYRVQDVMWLVAIQKKFMGLFEEANPVFSMINRLIEKTPFNDAEACLERIRLEFERLEALNPWENLTPDQLDDLVFEYPEFEQWSSFK